MSLPAFSEFNQTYNCIMVTKLTFSRLHLQSVGRASKVQRSLTDHISRPHFKSIPFKWSVSRANWLHHHFWKVLKSEEIKGLVIFLTVQRPDRRSVTWHKPIWGGLLLFKRTTFTPELNHMSSFWFTQFHISRHKRVCRPIIIQMILFHLFLIAPLIAVFLCR